LTVQTDFAAADRPAANPMTDQTTSARPGRNRFPTLAIVLGVLAAANLAFVWAFPHFISQDGATHVYNASILLQFLRQAFDGGVAVDQVHRQYNLYFRLNPTPIPNLFSHAALVGLLTFLSPAVAEKALVSLYVILWPVSLVCVLRAIRRDAAWLAILAMPLCMNWFLHMGFYNFCFGIEFFLLALAWWLRHRRHPRAGRLVVFGALALLLYFSHLVALVEFWIVAGGVLIVSAWRRRKTGSRSIARESIPWIAAALPALALSVWFVATPHPTKLGSGSHFDFNLAKLHRLLGAFPGSRAFLFTEDLPATTLHLAFAAFFFGALIVRCRRRRSRSADGILLAMLLAFAAFLLASNDSGGGSYLLHRLQFFACLIGLLWMASQPFARPPRLAIQAFGAGMALVFLALRIGPCVGIASQQREFESLFDNVRPGATVLPVVLTAFAMEPPDRFLTVHTFPLLHVNARAAVRRGFIDLANYEASTDHFPLRWREGLDPQDTIGPITHPVAVLEVLAYRDADGGRVEYIATWDNGGGESATEAKPYLMRQIEAFYRPVALSSPRGFGKLYRLDRPDTGALVR
jgi:hypothetical protein